MTDKFHMLLIKLISHWRNHSFSFPALQTNPMYCEMHRINTVSQQEVSCHPHLSMLTPCHVTSYLMRLGNKQSFLEGEVNVGKNLMNIPNQRIIYRQLQRTTYVLRIIAEPYKLQGALSCPPSIGHRFTQVFVA